MWPLAAPPFDKILLDPPRTGALEVVKRIGALDANLDAARTILLRATSQEIGATREEVIDGTVQRLDLSRKQAGDAYALAEQHEQNPRSVWGFVLGLTRLSQQTPWQDARLGLDRAASRLLTSFI